MVLLKVHTACQQRHDDMGAVRRVSLCGICRRLQPTSVKVVSMQFLDVRSEGKPTLSVQFAVVLELALDVFHTVVVCRGTCSSLSGLSKCH
jgi:hypothetical protein